MTRELHPLPGMNKAASLYKAVILPWDVNVVLGDPYCTSITGNNNAKKANKTLPCLFSAVDMVNL